MEGQLSQEKLAPLAGDELSGTRGELAELRAQNTRAKEQMSSASARLRAAQKAMASVQLQRRHLGEAKKGGETVLFRSSVLLTGQADGNVPGSALESDPSISLLLQRERVRIDSLEAELNEARCVEAALRADVAMVESECEDVRRQLDDSHSVADVLRHQLREEATARCALEAEVRRLRAECEVRGDANVAADSGSQGIRQAHPAMPAAPSPTSATPHTQPPPQQPEKVIIMTSSSMRTLETDKSEQNMHAPGTTSALVAAPGALQSPRQMLPASSMPVRQCSAGTVPVMRQAGRSAGTGLSSAPVFRQVSNDLRPLGSPKSPAGDGGGFGLGKDAAGGPPPPAGQVFRRFSGNGGVTSPRPAPGGSTAAGGGSGNAVVGVGTAPPMLSAGGRVGTLSSLQSATMQHRSSVSSGPLLPGVAGQAPTQGRITPQRLVPSQAGVDPRWGHSAQMPPGALLQAANRGVMM